MAELADVDEVATRRLRLRRWRDDDLAAYRRITGDPAVMAHFPGVLTPAEADGQVEWFEHHWRRHGFGVWAVEHRRTGDLIGRIGLVVHTDWPHGPSEAEVGWLLGRPWWGQGLATEGAMAAVREAFGPLRLRRLVSITRPDNERSRRVMERLGMLEQGSRHWRDEPAVWYAVDHPDIAAQTAPRTPRATTTGPRATTTTTKPTTTTTKRR
jgi:RimJ/RimL family protein N-acetyltransferase